LVDAALAAGRIEAAQRALFIEQAIRDIETTRALIAPPLGHYRRPAAPRRGARTNTCATKRRKRR